MRVPGSPAVLECLLSRFTQTLVNYYLLPCPIMVALSNPKQVLVDSRQPLLSYGGEEVRLLSSRNIVALPAFGAPEAHLQSIST
jgi:hypothetical protein